MVLTTFMGKHNEKHFKSFSLKMHFLSIGTLIFSTFLLSHEIGGEKFSALSEMENLARDEEKIIQEFEKFLIEMDDIMEYLKL